MCKISVVMAVYNADKFLNEAIDSILNQTFKDFEFIIVNDGSTDKSLNIIKSYLDERIVVIDQENNGLSKSLNIGIAKSKSNLIARMDADDVSEKTRLEKQLNFMDKYPNCAVLGTNANVIDQEGDFLYKSNLFTNNDQIKNILPESPFFHSSTIFRKNLFYSAGKYPEDIYHFFEDKVLWNKLAHLGDFKNLEEGLIQYRLVPNSISNLPAKRIKELREIANEIILNGYTFHASDVKKIISITTISKNEKKANYYLKIGTIKLKNTQRLVASKNLLISLLYSPIRLDTLLKVFACVLPSSVIKKLGKR